MGFTGLKKRGQNLRNERTTFPHVFARKGRAKLREKEREKRNDEQQLALLNARPGECKKERAKLEKRIAERSKPAKKEEKK